MWKPQHDAYNQKLVKRQEVLAQAWSGLTRANPPDDRDAFQKAWQTVRAAALRKADFEVIFE